MDDGQQSDSDSSSSDDGYLCFIDGCDKDADACGSCVDHCDLRACTIPTHIEVRSKKTRKRQRAPSQTVPKPSATASDLPKGPLRAKDLDDGTIWLQSIAAWRISPTFAADDSDRVRAALDYFAAAWSQGASDLYFKYFTTDGNLNKRRFTPKPAPDGIADEDWEAERSEAILAAVPTINMLLVILRAYARGSMLVLKKHTHLAVVTEMRSDAFYAIERTQSEVPKRDISDPIIHEEAWDGPERALWWYLLAASTTVGRIRKVLEKTVDLYGTQYRTANPTVFTPIPVWNLKYSPEAVRRRGARSIDDEPTYKRRALRATAADDDDVASAAGAAASSVATPTPVKPSPVRPTKTSTDTSTPTTPKKGTNAWWKAQRLAGLAPKKKSTKKKGK